MTSALGRLHLPEASFCLSRVSPAGCFVGQCHTATSVASLAFCDSLYPLLQYG
jgi:hypothetical protein